VVQEAILGREHELLVVDGFIRGVADSPSALLIRGKPGIGKTTMWLSGVDAASGAGYRMLSSRSVEAEAKMSFTTLGDLLGGVIEESGEQLPEPQRQAIDAALLRVGNVRPDRLAVSLATSALLRSLAEAGPVLLAIDDIQWIDPASAKVLSFAIRRLRMEPIGILASLRVAPGSEDPLGLLPASAEPPCRILDMGSLDVTALSQLLRLRLGADLPHTLMARIHAVCDGNPFYGLEIGHALLERDSLPAPGEPLPIPDDLRTLLGSRLASLPAGVRDTLMLVAAAVHPTISLVRSVSPRSEQATANLDEAAAAKVIDVDGETVRFTHPLFASTVYANASADERRSAHRRLARAVVNDEERARHLALASHGPDEEVAAALDVAASSASARGAPDSAAHLEDLAVRLTPAVDERSIRSRLLHVSTYRYSAGDAQTAREVLEDLIDATPIGPERAGLRFELSNLVWNDVERVRRLLDQVREDAGEEMSVELDARVELAMGWVGQMGGDLAEGSRHGWNALAAAEALDDARLVIEALTFLGFDEFLLGRPTRSILERAILLTDAVGQQPVRIDSARRVLGATLMWGGALDEARAELERDHADTVRSGGLTYQWEELVYLAELELRAGNWDLAARYASEGLESTLETGLEEAREVHLWSSALVAAHRGDIEIARASASEGLRIAEAHGDVFHVVTNRSALGFLELSLGNAAGAQGWLGPLVELTDRWGLRQPSVFPFLPDEIEALIILGDLDGAATLLDRLEKQGEALGSALALATGARCRASLAAASQDPEKALQAIEEALAHHRRVPQPFDLARTHFTAGEILRRSKKKAAARVHLERALGIFEELGAQLWSVRTREALNRVGGRAPSPTELTETERKVAELVGTGKTNAEVAGLLFMSVNTVRSNLRRIYGKLGIRSRSELSHALRNLSDAST
jgi:DNA-binding CsgD family transcriptional regulator